MSTAQEIVDAIVNYVGNEDRSDWYVGIAADATDALFNRHNVDKEGSNGGWIYDTAPSNAAARAAEKALHDGGFDGGPGGGDDKTRSVYAYRKAAATSED